MKSSTEVPERKNPQNNVISINIIKTSGYNKKNCK